MGVDQVNLDVPRSLTGASFRIAVTLSRPAHSRKLQLSYDKVKR
jgi:hypothetical protein